MTTDCVAVIQIFMTYDIFAFMVHYCNDCAHLIYSQLSWKLALRPISSQLRVILLGHISPWKRYWKAIDNESTGPGSGICRWSCFGPNSNRIACSCSEHTFRVATLVCGVVGGEIWDSFWMVVGILMINILIININIIWIIISIFIQIRHTHWFIGNKKNIYIFAFWTRKNLWWLIFPLPFIQVHHRHDITITFQESSLPQQQQQQQHRRCDASDEAT